MQHFARSSSRQWRLEVALMWSCVIVLIIYAMWPRSNTDYVTKVPMLAPVAWKVVPPR
jgi:hypothetical protein